VEDWMVSLGIALVGLVSTFAVLRNKVNDSEARDKKQDEKIAELNKFMNEKAPFLDHLSRAENAFGQKIDIHSKEIIELKTKMANIPTMNEVRSEFVSKEMFKQMEKHIDEKFDKLENGIDKILSKLDKE
jgi:hypothetical protein